MVELQEQSYASGATVSKFRKPIRVGARGSRLARWQTDHLIELLHRAWPDLTFEIVTISTTGDQRLETPHLSVKY